MGHGIRTIYVIRQMQYPVKHSKTWFNCKSYSYTELRICTSSIFHFNTSKVWQRTIKKDDGINSVDDRNDAAVPFTLICENTVANDDTSVFHNQAHVLIIYTYV